MKLDTYSLIVFLTLTIATSSPITTTSTNQPEIPPKRVALADLPHTRLFWGYGRPIPYGRPPSGIGREKASPKPSLSPSSTSKSDDVLPQPTNQLVPQCGKQVWIDAHKKGSCAGQKKDKCWCNDHQARKYYAYGIVDKCHVTREREFWQMEFNKRCRKEGGKGFRDVMWKGGSTPVIPASG